MIDATPLYDDIQAWKKNCGFPGPLGVRCYKQFMKQHKEALSSRKGVKKDVNRQQWGTYANMGLMYDSIYECMAKEGVAWKLDTPVWMDQHGNITSCDKAFGLAVEYELLYPERVLHMDETGCNTNMKTDGRVGGKKYIAEAGSGKANLAAACTDIRFTVLPITNSLGRAVLCVVIFQSEQKNIPASWITGIDINGIGPSKQDPTDFMDIKTMATGPICVVGNKEVPCLCLSSPHGGITSELLVEVFKYMDTLNIFPQTQGLPNPFVVLNGHNS